jgi:hypothetical protein
MPRGVIKKAEDKLAEIVLMSLAAAAHFDQNEIENMRSMSKKQFAEHMNTLDAEQKIIAKYFNELPNWIAKEADLLIEEFRGAFDLEEDYDDLYKLVESKSAKYAKQYNKDDSDDKHLEVVKTVKKDFTAAQKKPIKQYMQAEHASAIYNEDDLRLQIANLRGQVGKLLL